MNGYMFQTYQKVPARVIKAIGKDIKANLELRLRHLDQETQRAIAHDFDMAVDQVSDENSPSVDGYRLTDKQVAEVADCIRNGKPISGIKEFRYATGAGLSESKQFIDKFTKGHSWEEAFMMFTNAFAAC